MNIFMLVFISLLAAGCAAEFGDRQENGMIVIKPDKSYRRAYFIRPHIYRSDIEPMMSNGWKAIENYLVRTKSSLPADGQPNSHEVGNFQLVYFCKDRIEARPVQIRPPSSSFPLTTIELSCEK